MTFDELLDALKTYQDMVAGLNVNIKKIKRQILETKEAQDIIAPIRNEGGQRKADNLTLMSKVGAHRHRHGGARADARGAGSVPRGPRRFLRRAAREDRGHAHVDHDPPDGRAAPRLADPPPRAVHARDRPRNRPPPAQVGAGQAGRGGGRGGCGTCERSSRREATRSGYAPPSLSRTWSSHDLGRPLSRASS